MDALSILLCFAVSQEARFLSVPETLKTRVRVSVTGIGKANSLRVIERELARQPPGLVLTCGFAGALRPDLPLRSLLFSADARSGLDQMLGELGGMRGQFHCSTRIASSATEKARLWQTTHADAVEMESGFIRQVCQKQAIPSATIRVISDTAEEDLPLDFNSLLTERSEIDYRRLAWALMRSPGRIPALLTLQHQTKEASRVLGRFLNALLARHFALQC